MAKEVDRSARKRTEDSESRGRIQVRVSDFEHGLRVYDSVRLVRIHSKEYSLLIMEDYYPAMGSVRGTVELVTDTDQIRLGRVKGFYLHRSNEFSLLIEEYLPGQGDKAEEETV